MAATTDSNSTWRSAPSPGCRSRGASKRRAARNRSTSHRSWTLSTLAGSRPETVAADKGYDNARVYAECEERGCEPVIPLRGVKGKQPVLPIGIGGRLFPRITRHSERFRSLYRRRAAVERAFGDLKHNYGLAPLRVRGLAKVQLHADLTMLARLSLALRTHFRKR